MVVKTTNLISRTCIDTGFEPPYLLIYRGKVFIESFGCRNDCLTVHFNCRKRRNAGFSPLELKLHSYSICCIIRTCGEKLHVPVALSLLYFCAVNTHMMQFLCFFESLFWGKEIILCNYNSFSWLIQTSFNSVSGGLANYNDCRESFCER